MKLIDLINNVKKLELEIEELTSRLNNASQSIKDAKESILLLTGGDPEVKEPEEAVIEPKLDQVLMKKLKTWRLIKAKELAMPAYIVFTNSVLEDICKKLPASKHEFIDIKGISDNKFEKYGQDIIDILKAHQTKIMPEPKSLITQPTSDEQDVIEELELIQVEVQFLKDKDTGLEIISECELLIESTENKEIIAKVRRTIMTVKEKCETLPYKVVFKKQVGLEKAIRKINAEAPVCRKCDSQMVLRQGASHFFFGCSTFPKCFSTRYLKSEQLEQLDL